MTLSQKVKLVALTLIGLALLPAVIVAGYFVSLVAVLALPAFIVAVVSARLIAGPAKPTTDVAHFIYYTDCENRVLSIENYIKDNHLEDDVALTSAS